MVKIQNVRAQLLQARNIPLPLTIFYGIVMQGQGIRLPRFKVRFLAVQPAENEAKRANSNR